MNDNKLKQKVQRGGALFLVAVMCFTGLVGCGTKKPNKEPIKKPGTTQVEPNKKPTSNKTDSKTNTDKKDSSKVDIDKKDDKDASETDVDKKDDKGADQKDDKTSTTDVPAKAPVKNPSKDSGKQDTGATQTDSGKQDTGATQTDTGKKDNTKPGTAKKDNKKDSKKGNSKAPSIRKAPTTGKIGSRGGK